jgi:RNA 3'-terminal phosphate cyclase (ATP)
VAQDAINQTRQYLAADVPIGTCLADQLLLPFALAGGGSITTMPPTRHTQTNAAIIEHFLPVRIRLQQEAQKRWRVTFA